LMVMKKEFGEEQMRKFLRYELRSYLTGRSLESKKEKPLELVEGQGYIHYRKGSVVMYALQDYVGENKVNAAYRKYLNDWRVENGKYPSTADFMPYLYEVTPDSLQYLLTDMFETITLFENKVEEATYTALDNGKYEVTMKLSAEKMRADSLGNETVIPINDWVDVGIFKEDKDDDEGDSVRFPLYLKKHKITGKETEFTFVVDTIPANVGFDPYNKLIDRHSSDNVLGVDEKEADEAL
ncbi:MAG: hypothetical protein ACPGXL_02730, partial [Chitinophagales bacterium]